MHFENEVLIIFILSLTVITFTDNVTARYYYNNVLYT